jgi:predicted nucleotidyltransferase
LRPHHRQTIDRLTDLYENDPCVLGLMIGGSIAKGWDEENSDVDFLLVVTPDEYKVREQNKDLPVLRNDLTDYEGGYVDGKRLTMDFIREVAEKGSEPAKSAFLGAWVTIDRTGGEFTELVQSIPVYPIEGHDERVRAFYSQTMTWNWFVGEAIKRQNRYLLLQAVTSISLFAMRLVLAVNHRLYPYHKWVNRAVDECEDKPTRFGELRDEMLENPSVTTAQAFVDCVAGWKDWGIPWNEVIQRFLVDREWNWRDHQAPIEDW